jgi:hypothetical protein
MVPPGGDVLPPLYRRGNQIQNDVFRQKPASFAAFCERTSGFLGKSPLWLPEENKVSKKKGISVICKKKLLQAFLFSRI